jgi:hypothetical protein
LICHSLFYEVAFFAFVCYHLYEKTPSNRTLGSNPPQRNEVKPPQKGPDFAKALFYEVGRGAKMDDKIAAWLDYLHSQRGLATSTQKGYRLDMRLLVAHLVDRDGRHFLAGVAQQHGPITDVGDTTAKHLAAFLVPLNLADPGRRSPRPADAETTATSCLLPHTHDKVGDGSSVVVDLCKIKR